jgi:hypothetical protein
MSDFKSDHIQAGQVRLHKCCTDSGKRIQHPTLRIFFGEISIYAVLNEISGESSNPRHPAMKRKVLVLSEG